MFLNVDQASNPMNKHHAERAYLLYLAKSGISNSRRPAGLINQTDFAAVYTPPTNCPTPFGGPCLIWRHRLDADGYGVLQFEGKTCKAHRVAYEMSRGSIPPGKLILHMCHRRSCIQPAHLYAGTRKQNAEDRQVRLNEEERWKKFRRFFDEYAPRMHDGMKYYWDEPPESVRTLFQQQTGEHRCKYIIPAGEHLTTDGKVEPTKLCHICFAPDPEWPALFDEQGPQEEEAAIRVECRVGVDSFLRDRGPGDKPLNIVPGRPAANPQSRPAA